MRKIIVLLLCVFTSVVMAQQHTLVFTETPSPTIAVTSVINPSTCGANDGKITVNGGVGSTYVWSNGATTATAQNLSSGNYTVTVTNVGKCSADSTISLTDPGAPTITNQPLNVTVCTGLPFTLSVTATGTNLTYQWYKGTFSINGAIGSSYYVSQASINDAGNYSCMVTSGACHVTSNVATVTVNAGITVEAGNNVTINYGQSTTLGSGSVPNVSYVWSPAAGLSNPNISNPVANPTTSTTYSVTATSNSGCTATDQVTVTVIGSPLTATVTANPQTICPDGSSQLAAQGHGGSGVYTYVWSPTTGLSNPNIANPVATLNTSMAYAVTVSDGSSTTTANIVVNVSTPPTADAGLDQTIPLSSSATIGTTSTPGYTYLWSSNPSGFTSAVSNPTVIPTVSTIYTVLVTNSVGCTNSDQVTVFVTGGPFVFVNPSVPITSSLGTTIFAGQSTNLNCLVSGGTPPYNYIWSPMTGLSNPNIANPVATPTDTITYTIIVTDGASSTLTANITINVIPPTPPTAAISGGPKYICLGDTATLTITLTGVSPWDVVYYDGSSSYPLTITSSPYSLKVSPTTTSVYTITSVMDINGNGTTSGYALVDVYTLPIVNAGSDVNICPGSTTTLTATCPTATSYTWSNGGNQSTTTVGPLTATTYTVTVADAHGCKASDAVVVSLYSAPTANAGPDQDICQGETTNLNATGGATYAWSSNPSGFSSSLPNPSVSPNTSTGYTVTVTDNNGCTATDYMVINVTTKPTVTINDQITCSGQEVILMAVPSINGGTYQWSNDSTTQSIKVTPLTTKSYSVIYTLGACSVPQSGTVVVNPTPIANLGPDQTTCAGNNVTLTNSITTYAYYLWNTGANTASITVKPNSTTTYILTVTDANGCSAVDTILVNANPKPTVIISPASSVICAGTSVTLTGNGAVSYLWSNGKLQDTIIVSPTTSTNYSVVGYSSNGCAASATASIFVNPLPDADAGNDTIICEGNSVLLQATGGIFYKWDNGINQATQLVTPTSTTNYIVTVTDANNCTAIDNVAVIVSSNPTVQVINDSVAICAGQSTTLTTTSTGATTFNWFPTTGLSNPNIANPVASPVISVTYTIVVKNAAGCQANDQVTVIVNSVPVITASSQVYGCEGQDIQLNASSSINGCTFSWTPSTGLSDPNIANPVSNLTATTAYTLMVTSPEGCIGVKSVTVNIQPKPVAAFSATVTLGCVATFTNSSTGGTSYKWDFGDGTTSTDKDPVHTYTANGNFNVWLTVYNDCDSDMVNHMLTDIIGINEVTWETQNISIYPNPVIDVLTLSGIEKVEEIQLINSIGQVLNQQKITEGTDQIQLDMEQLSPGIYYVHFMTLNGMSFNKKVVKGIIKFT